MFFTDKGRREKMKKAIWFTGVLLIVCILAIGGYLLFFQEKNSKIPEGTFVRTERAWDAWQRSA